MNLAIFDEEFRFSSVISKEPLYKKKNERQEKAETEEVWGLTI